MAVDFNRYSTRYCFGHLDCKAIEKALMEKLTLDVLITPIIALLLNGYCYFYFRRQTFDRRKFQQLWLAIIIFSLILNFIWEMLQMPLFKNMPWSWQSTLFCALASVVDMLMVLLLYNAFAVFTKTSLWVFSISGKQIALLILIGGIGAVLAERRHLIAGSWNYSEAMPVIPIAEAGLSPVIQFMLLPLLIFKLSVIVVNRRI